MTNLSSSNKKKSLINPESLLFLTPITLGIIVLCSLLFFVFKPLMGKLYREESQIKSLEDKVLYLPIYKKYIKDLSILKTKAKKQQTRLIELISDPNQLETILSEINEICIKNNVVLLKIEPKDKVKYITGNKLNSTKIQTSLSSGQDPFLVPYVEKYMFNLSLKGTFNNLVAFLKELEMLQTISIADNIDITSIQKNTTDQSANDQVNLKMTFNLSTYSKVKDKNNYSNKK